MSDFSIKAHDRLPSIQAQLFSGNDPVNLSTATTVFFTMRLVGSTGTPKVDTAATIVDAINGIVRYDWVDADTANPGSYEAEWEVTWTGGKKQTFPTLTYHTVDILADLDGS